MKIILGSKSPRRKELIAGLGIEFEIRTKDTDESYPADLPVNEIANYIANNKAKALIPTLSEDEIIICADTIVVIDHQILGKPEDTADAKRMLHLLSGKTHDVITGVVIANQTKKQMFSVTTKVSFKELTSEEIEYYIEQYQPFDKAGSYGIQEWIGYIGIPKIEGSYFNVVGLPVHEVYEALKEFN